MLPGLGANIVDWLGYGHAVQSAKDKSKFGQGDIRGAIAPESANTATRVVWPRPPLVLALVLGSLMENWFQRSMSVHEGIGWLQRPIVLAVIAAPGAMIALLILYYDFRGATLSTTEHAGFASALRAARDKAVLGRAGEFFVYLLAVLALTLIAGQMVALVAFAAAYLWRWGGYGWKVSLGYAACGWAFLYLFYDKLMNVLWHPSLLGERLFG